MAGLAVTHLAMAEFVTYKTHTGMMSAMGKNMNTEGRKMLASIAMATRTNS